MRFYTTLKLGPNREMTRDGFTIFRNVSVSRTGEQIYGPNEGTGIAPGPDGLIHIMRTPEEVFRPETLDSGNGKSLVINHPDDDVTPDNWRQLTHGFMVNLRRGAGEQKDESVADIIVATPEALREIDLGLREVSLGYDADYFETGPGHGEQRNIFINHVALVEAGRCGSRCAVRDHKPKETCMKNKDKKSFMDKILACVRNKDEQGAQEALKEMEEGNGSEGSETHVHIHTGAAPRSEDEQPEDPTEKRFKAIEDSIKQLSDSFKASRDGETEEEKRQKAEDAESEEELEEETGTEDARKAKDSAMLSDVFDTVKMNAEIIAPGVQVPTFDAKADPKKTFRDCICGLRRKALRMATQDATTATMITAVRGRTLDANEVGKLSCGQVRSLFNGVAAMKRAANNGTVTRDSVLTLAKPGAKTDDNLSPAQRFKQKSRDRWSGGKK
jgi:uncharacterized protein